MFCENVNLLNMKIIHLSDLHISDQGHPIWETDTLRHFDLCIQGIAKENGVDAIIVSGDLADKGSEWAYQYIDGRFAELNVPTYICPGNHDRLSTMQSYLKFCKYETVVNINAWKFIFLDTTIVDEYEPSQNKARGIVKQGDFDMIDSLAASSTQPICIVMHHPPIEPGGWMNNKKLLGNRNEFKEFINKYDSIRMVIFGHIHYPFHAKECDIIYSSAPSIGFAFNPNLPKYQIESGAEGYHVLMLDDCGNLVNIKQQKI